MSEKKYRSRDDVRAEQVAEEEFDGDDAYPDHGEVEDAKAAMGLPSKVTEP